MDSFFVALKQRQNNVTEKRKGLILKNINLITGPSTKSLYSCFKVFYSMQEMSFPRIERLFCEISCLFPSSAKAYIQ